MSVQTSEPVSRRELCQRLARAQIRIDQKSIEIENLRAKRFRLREIRLGLDMDERR